MPTINEQEIIAVKEAIVRNITYGIDSMNIDVSKIEDEAVLAELVYELEGFGLSIEEDWDTRLMIEVNEPLLSELGNYSDITLSSKARSITMSTINYLLNLKAIDKDPCTASFILGKNDDIDIVQGMKFLKNELDEATETILEVVDNGTNDMLVLNVFPSGSGVSLISKLQYMSTNLDYKPTLTPASDKLIKQLKESMRDLNQEAQIPLFEL